MIGIDLELNNNNNNRKLIIEDFMGGRLILPMKPRMKIKRFNKNELEELTTEESFISFLNELWRIEGVKEIFQLFGAKLEEK
ncbi:MAG: hypothetical protein KGD70_12050 [Candidatus Lokiarchaeota archaeon]|nr:hypothetical protein [Candidatus Lokiarchaeota archaeon]